MHLRIRFTDIKDRQLGSFYIVTSYKHCADVESLHWTPSRELGFSNRIRVK